jgi:hypothetical protein
MRLLWRRRTARETDHELIWLAVSVAAMAGGAGWLALSLPWPRCPFFAVTGLPCLTCGATRSAIAVLHGDFLSALRWNPLAFVALGVVIAFDLYAGKNAVRIAAICLLALNWIYLLAHHDRF